MALRLFAAPKVLVSQTFSYRSDSCTYRYIHVNTSEGSLQLLCVLCAAHRELRDVPELNVRRWLSQKKQLLIEIFQGKEYSRRHQSFVKGAKHRGTLVHCILAPAWNS